MTGDRVRDSEPGAADRPAGGHGPVGNRDVWLIVPCFNEGTVIEDVLRSARETFPNIVAVDDGSADDSASAIHRAGAHLVRHPVNLGQGAAIQTGVEYARAQPGAEFFVTFDADGQHSPTDAAAMVAAARDEDLEHLYEMAKLTGGGFTNLPPDRKALRAKLDRSHTAFARTGDPGFGWPAYTTADRKVLVLDDPDDPTPYWLVSTRRPAELLAALGVDDAAADRPAPTA